jgi:SAM-dependent methyltransferase
MTYFKVLLLNICMRPYKYIEGRIILRRQRAEFRSDWKKYSEAYEKSSKRLALEWKDRFPIVHEKTSYTPFDRHYTYHPAWAARVLNKTQPAEHVDISSLLLFSVLVSAFVPTRFYDYRPAKLDLEGFESDHADLTKLPFADKSIKSLSCMHVVEHVGLGRYGDPIDVDGDMKALKELQRVVAAGGDLLVVVPVGKPRIMYNAHRIYGYEDVINALDELDLVEFALIPDKEEDGGLLYGASKELVNSQEYGCGCYWFKRNLPRL